VDAVTGGVGEVVVFLRGVDPRVSRPWDLAPVVVVQDDYRLVIRQGARTARHGFVRCGDAVSLVSRQPVFHSLHADGAAFFTLAFPEPDRSLTRVFPRSGLVELSSAAGYYWMRAHLFVADHPYYCATDESGAFELTGVPPGSYDLICWSPNWHLERRDRDPESGLVMRARFRPAVGVTRRVRVDAAGRHQIDFRLRAEDFDPPDSLHERE
jgi:hypothetical protein